MGKRDSMEFGVVPKILSKLNARGNYEDRRVSEKYGRRIGSDFGYLPKYKAIIGSTNPSRLSGKDRPADEGRCCPGSDSAWSP